MNRKSIYQKPLVGLAILTLTLGGLIAFNNARQHRTSYSWISLSAKDNKESLEQQVLEHPDAKILNIFRSPLHDEDTAALARLTEVDYLQISESELGAQTIARIIHLPSLKRIYLAQQKFREPQQVQSLIDTIAQSPALEDLYLDGIPLSGLDLSALEKLKHLDSVSIQDAQLTSEQLSFLGKLPSLTKVTLLGNPIDCSLITTLANARLTALRLGKTQINDTCAAAIAAHSNLNFLDLSDTKLSADGVAALSGLKDLDFLILSNLPVTVEGISKFVAFSRLSDLDLSGTQITDGFFAALKNVKALESLSIARTALSKEELLKLETLITLYTLDLSDTAADDEVISNVLRLGRLGTLNLSRTKITEASLSTLSRLKSLEELELVGTALSPAALEKFQQQNPAISVTTQEEPKGLHE